MNRIAGLVILAIFYGIYIGKMLLQKRKGIRTDQMARGRRRDRVFYVEVILKLATYSVVAVELISIILTKSYLPEGFIAAGGILGLVGDVIFATAVITMRDSWRAGLAEADETRMITDGIYRYSRNPAFLGFDLVYLGILLMFFNWILFVFSMFAIIMLHIQILQEESYLPKVFGEEYAAYRSRVCRYLGRKPDLQMERVLYVTDLDGTLLNRSDRINPESIEIINDLVSKGMLFTYATARSLVSASVVTEGLSTDIPVIAYNGAFIFQAATGEILSQERFSEEELNAVKHVLCKYNISPLVYSFVDGAERVSWIMEKENEGIRRYLSKRKGDRRLRPVESEEKLYQGDMFYFTCIGEKEELAPIYDVFSKDNRYHCTIQQELYRPEFWCEIMPACATKAHAIEKLKKIWNCTKVVSFGDAVNDIPMFQVSDEAYAVENAVEELKALATGIIDSNENDGVARWLKGHAVIEKGNKNGNT